MTLRSIERIMTGAAKRIEREQMFLDVAAWQIGALVRVGFHKPKDFPDLNKFLGRRRKPQQQNWQDMKTVARMMTAAMGGEVRKK
ncbi:hypothetical protein [uncultured Pelagimonas sp.]|uniref:hypothetical protein n=1 Tax=uncultured Pelagimonas sp. TaxID=1618102 RepID=UPI00262BDA38|nr:hypothetical protein [uncultured Pelagimonas sp.]